MANDHLGRFAYPLSGKSKKSDYALILHMVASMKPETGRVTTIAPRGACRNERRGSGQAKHPLRLACCSAARDGELTAQPLNLYFEKIGQLVGQHAV